MVMEVGLIRLLILIAHLCLRDVWLDVGCNNGLQNYMCFKKIGTTCSKCVNNFRFNSQNNQLGAPVCLSKKKKNLHFGNE